MASVFDVANWFLNYNKFLRETLDEDTDDITNLKMQKLLYYSQAAHLALTDKPLFSNPIVAWTHGPVVREVYSKYKSYGSNGITEIEDYNINPKEEEILKQVYDVFGHYSAWGLRNLTHEETPWQETESNKEMDLSKIKEYFKENYLG